MPDGVAARFDSVAYPADDERALQTVLLHPASAVSARAGRRPGPGLEVTVGGTPEAATVAAGGGVIYEAAVGGTYLFHIPAPVDLTLPARPGAGTSRIDYVLARILNEDERPGDTLREVDLYLLSGTAGASPTAPTIPTGHLRLARLDIPASGTIAVSQAAPRMAAAGGIITVVDDDERDAISPIFDGIMVYREDNDTYEGRVNGAWEVVFPQAVPWKTGTATMTFNSSGEAVLNHNFGSIPTYFNATHDSGGSNIDLKPKTGTLAANTVTLIARKTTDGTAYVGSLTTVRWVALD